MFSVSQRIFVFFEKKNEKIVLLLSEEDNFHFFMAIL